jgi:hypothetical protein
VLTKRDTALFKAICIGAQYGPLGEARPFIVHSSAQRDHLQIGHVEGLHRKTRPPLALEAKCGAGKDAICTDVFAEKMELRMNRKLLLSVAGAAAALFIGFGAAQAAPASGSLDTLKTLGLEQSNVEEARWRCRRRCYWHRGHRHCRRVCRRWW